MYNLHLRTFAHEPPGDTILDPFSGSCTTGIAANLLDRKFIGIDQNKDFLDLGIRRRKEIADPVTAKRMLKKMSENPEEVMVMANPYLHVVKSEIGCLYFVFKE